MPQLTKSDLIYDDYSWKAVPGDDPTKTKEDADRFSRHEGYEVLHLLNAFKDSNGRDLSVKDRQIIEWMIHDKLPSNIQGRSNVTRWISDNFYRLAGQAPF